MPGTVRCEWSICGQHWRPRCSGSPMQASLFSKSGTMRSQALRTHVACASWSTVPVQARVPLRLLHTCNATSESSSAVTSTAPPAEELTSASPEVDGVLSAKSGIAAEAAPSDARLPKRRRTQVETTDGVATFLTRRFGIAGGLAWLGFLAVGTLGEQVKTRLEVASEQSAAHDVSGAAEVVTPSGLHYVDQRIGGGQQPAPGLLVVVDYVGRADGVVFEDTRARGKPIVFVYGRRPLTGGMCPGADEALSSMRAGGRRRVVVPTSLGFGQRGAVLRPTEHVPDKQGIIPPGATLEYELELLRVSVPPS